MNKLETSNENPNEIYAKTVELASLVGTYLWKTNYKNLIRNDFINKIRLKKSLKELQKDNREEISVILDGKEHTMNEGQLHTKLSEVSEKINNILNNFHNLTKIDGAVKSETDDNGLDSLNLEDLLDDNFTYDVMDRIRELYSQDKVRTLYESEMQKRKEDFEILKNGYDSIKEILEIDKIIEQAKDKILSIRIKSFQERRKISPKEMVVINKIKEHIELKELEKLELLSHRETATVYRLETLRKYIKQLETTGYIKTPSLEKLIEKTIDKVLLGKNVLLTWPTGTGKTVLAIEAVKTIAKKLNLQVDEISGKKLWEELKDWKNIKELDEFVEVLSWHAGITPSEFISKIKLQTDGKWWTETVSELGKILKSFVNGNIPIIDEIDLIPNDVLMRIKHLFTLKVGKSYSPQENGDQRYILNNTSVIATANIKSDKHPDREDMDPAIIRLFKPIEVGYLANDEIYDIALTSISQKEGFIYGVGTESLSNQPNSILHLLIAALKDIESNYLWIGDGENISNKTKQFLRKAVLELGNFIWLFAGFKESGQKFNDFIKEQVIDFTSNHAYPKSDRLILIKIFSSKWFITKSDIPLMIDKMTDIGEEKLEQNIISNSFSFEDSLIDFVDPYQLANLDPYNIRNLDDLELKNKKAEIVGFIQKLDSFLMEWNLSKTEKLENYIQDFFDKIENDINYDLDNIEKQQELLSLLYEIELVDWILKLEEEYPNFQEQIKILKILDMSKGKKLFGNIDKKEDKSIVEYIRDLDKLISTEDIEWNSDKIEKLQEFLSLLVSKTKEDIEQFFEEKEKQQEFLALLYDIGLVDQILILKKFNYFKENIKILKILDKNSETGKNILPQDDNSIEWVENFEVGKLEIGMKVTTMDEKRLGIIVAVDKKTNKVEVLRENGVVPYSKRDFSTLHKISKEYLLWNKNIAYSEQLEWVYDDDHSYLKTWLKVKSINIEWFIKEINNHNNEITIEDDSGKSWIYSFEDFLKQFVICNYDFDIFSIDDIKIGQFLKKEWSNKKYKVSHKRSPWNGDEVIGVENNWVPIEITREEFIKKWKPLVF